jgi:HEAT repeat protein
MRTRSLVRCGIFSLVGLSAPVQAQSLADRVSSAGDGALTFHFAPRPGVCGDGEHFIRTGRDSYHGSFSVNRPREACVVGPLQVRLTVRDGAVERVESWAGPLRSRNARDLGVVRAAEAARYLMTIAQRGAPSASAKAIFPAVLADSARVWPALLAIARDLDTRSKATRQEALLWLSRFASGAVAGRPDQPFEMEDDEGEADEDLKVHAVFVLSQLSNGAGIPNLLDVARSNPSLRVRSQALFWLGQSGDPRAIALFESVLRQ